MLAEHRGGADRRLPEASLPVSGAGAGDRQGAGGYDGSYSVVRNYLDKVRPAKAPLGEAPPTVRDVTNWLCRRPDTLTEDERPRLKAILDRCPEI